MKGKIETLSLEDCLKKYPETKKMFLEEGSAMWDIIYHPMKGEHKKIKTFVYFLHSEIAGWSWLIPQKRLVKNKKLPLYSFMVYVKPKFRKKGIASKLCYSARFTAGQKHRRMLVHPWNYSSHKFYKNLKILDRNQVDYFITNQILPRKLNQ